MEKNEQRCRPLYAGEIEIRVKQLSKDEKRAQLLLYKNARVDMALLDERFGAENWECDYKELKGSIYCGVAVNYGNGYVWKWDAGAESNKEPEKGEASDAFKRACVRHGQGTELYTAPDIWVANPATGIYRDTFRVSEIGYDENKEISRLVITDKQGAPVFGFEGGKCRAYSPRTGESTTAHVEAAGTARKVAIRKRTVTIEACEKGKAVNLIRELATYDDTDFAAWEVGKEAICRRRDERGEVTEEFEITPEAMEYIEEEALKIAQSRKLGKMQDEASREILSKRDNI